MTCFFSRFVLECYSLEPGPPPLSNTNLYLIELFWFFSWSRRYFRSREQTDRIGLMAGTHVSWWHHYVTVHYNTHINTTVILSCFAARKKRSDWISFPLDFLCYSLSVDFFRWELEELYSIFINDSSSSPGGFEWRYVSNPLLVKNSIYLRPMRNSLNKMFYFNSKCKVKSINLSL